MSSQNFDYSNCLFEARLQKPGFFRLRRKEQIYLYVSPTHMIINHEPYAKKPEIVLQLLPTTHIKWLWETKRTSILKSERADKSNSNQSVMSNRAVTMNVSQIKGFIIEAEGFVGEFIAEKVVMDMLKERFQAIILQSDFYDQYNLGKYLDKGNYAMVYLCTRKDNGKEFAVKILEKERLKSMKNGKESVFNELKIMRKLNHPNLMHLYEVFEDRNKYYFVVQLLKGITLYKQIQSRRKKSELDFKPHQIKAVVKQILQGIEHLHSINIMHRDLKPENILFSEKGILQKGDGSTGLKLVDYGLATYQHEKQVIFTKCGTPGFVAPQVIVYDERQPIYQVNVDIFSVGVILHILLVGEQSFPGRSRNTILNKNKECRLDFKSKKYQAIASDGVDLLMRMLEKDPAKRISAKDALEHPFFTKDKPVFKFKKSYKEEPIQSKPQLMQKYLNFDDPPQDNEKNLGTGISNGKEIQQKDNLDDFDPFSYEINEIPSELDFDSNSVSAKSIGTKRRKESESMMSQLGGSSGRKNSALLQRKVINSFGDRDNLVDDKNLGNFFVYVP